MVGFEQHCRGACTLCCSEGTQNGTQVVLLYGTLYVIFMVAVWWPVKNYWVRRLTCCPCQQRRYFPATIHAS